MAGRLPAGSNKSKGMTPVAIIRTSILDVIADYSTLWQRIGATLLRSPGLELKIGPFGDDGFPTSLLNIKQDDTAPLSNTVVILLSKATTRKVG